MIIQNKTIHSYMSLNRKITSVDYKKLFEEL